MRRMDDLGAKEDEVGDGVRGLQECRSFCWSWCQEVLSVCLDGKRMNANSSVTGMVHTTHVQATHCSGNHLLVQRRGKTSKSGKWSSLLILCDFLLTNDGENDRKDKIFTLCVCNPFQLLRRNMFCFLRKKTASEWMRRMSDDLRPTSRR